MFFTGYSTGEDSQINHGMMMGRQEGAGITQM